MITSRAHQIASTLSTHRLIQEQAAGRERIFDLAERENGRQGKGPLWVATDRPTDGPTVHVSAHFYIFRLKQRREAV
uniref:Uncharacterized protein n=1 Tax=Peronospora matthiolae TaxID=2874970 RepID=A0AAV1TFF2_9STRA